MRIFFDNLYIVLNKEEKRVLYFGNLHKSLLVTYKTSYYLECLFENKGEINDSFFNKYAILKKDFNRIVQKLIEKKILFETEENLKKCYFEKQYQRILNERNLNKAYLHVTQRCNLNCYYCYNKENLNRKTNELSTEDWGKVIKKLLFKGVKEFVITGGEPLLRNDLDKIIEYIPKECKITVLSNGTLLENKKIELLGLIDSIVVSLDSLNKQNNNDNRINSNSYDLVKNLKNIPIEFREKVSIRSVATKNNIADLEKVKAFAQELGMKFICSDCLPNSLNELDIFVPSETNDDYVFNINKMISCGAGSYVIAIDCEGNIYPCQSFIKKGFLLGNIMNDNWFENLQESKIKNELMKGINDVEGCNKCVFKYICGNGCKALQKNIYDSINVKNSFLCNYYKTKAKRDIINMFRKEKNEHLL